MFGMWDWLVLALYFAAMAAVGWYFSSRNKNFGDFMFGGGSMPWLAVGISMIATSVSATTFLGNPADAFANDMRLLMLNFGSLLSIIVVAFVFIPKYREAPISSAYELLELKFSRPVRLLAAVLYSLHLLLRSGILIFGPALVLQQVFQMPLFPTILLMSVLATLYTFFGGIKAVTWTDVIQFCIFFGSGLLVIWLAARQIGGLGETWNLATLSGKTRWLDFSMDPTDARNLLSAGLVYMVFETAIRGCDQQFVQRYLSCKSVREANYSSIASVVLGMAVGFLFFFLGAVLYVYYKVKMVQMLPEMGVNEVFPYFIFTNLPTGFRGLLVAAILAAAMSSLSSAFAALSNTAAVDFFPSKKKALGSDSPSGSGSASAAAEAAAALAKGRADIERSELWRARIWVLLWGVLATVAAFICALGQKSLLAKALYFTSLFIGPLLALFLMAFYRSRLHPWAVFGGALFGMASLLPFTTPPFVDPAAWKPLYAFSWPWNPLISLTASLAAAELLHILFRVLRIGRPAG